MAKRTATRRQASIYYAFAAAPLPRCCVINEVIMGENHWGSNPGAHLITNFLPKVSLPFPTFTLHHFREEMECDTVQDISLLKVKPSHL